MDPARARDLSVLSESTGPDTAGRIKNHLFTDNLTMKSKTIVVKVE